MRRWILLGFSAMFPFVAEAVQLYPNQGVEMPQAPIKSAEKDTQDILALIESQLNAIANQQFEVAYSNYSAATFRQSTTLAEYKYFVVGHPVFSKNKNAIFGNINFKKYYATVQGTLTAIDGQSQKVEYYLVKEGGLWKVAGIQLIQGSEVAPPLAPAPQYDFQHDIHNY